MELRPSAGRTRPRCGRHLRRTAGWRKTILAGRFRSGRQSQGPKYTRLEAGSRLGCRTCAGKARFEGARRGTGAHPLRLHEHPGDRVPAHRRGGENSGKDLSGTVIDEVLCQADTGEIVAACFRPELIPNRWRQTLAAREPERASSSIAICARSPARAISRQVAACHHRHRS